MPQRERRRRGRGRLALVASVIAAGVYWWLSQAPESPESESAPDPYASLSDEDLDPSAPEVACGVERWAVKTLSDNRGKLAMEGEPRTASIEDLTTRPSPRWHSGPERSPEEAVQYVVDAWIAGYKLEHDDDVHVVLSDERGLTMIAEFPHPDCVARLTAREPLARARHDLWALLPVEPTSSFRELEPSNWVPVHLRGVLFFDRHHGQYGQAINGVELHPVLDVARR